MEQPSGLSIKRKQMRPDCLAPPVPPYHPHATDVATTRANSCQSALVAVLPERSSAGGVTSAGEVIARCHRQGGTRAR